MGSETMALTTPNELDFTPRPAGGEEEGLCRAGDRCRVLLAPGLAGSVPSGSSTACVPLPAPRKAPERPAPHSLAAPSSLQPQATALAALACSQPGVDFELLTFHFSLLSCLSVSWIAMPRMLSLINVFYFQP